MLGGSIMTAYNTTLLIKKIIEKTRSFIIKWEKYDVNTDSNKFSSKYFSTINEINSNAGYFMSYYNGRLFLLPDLSGKLYLFMQPDPQYLPFTFVPPGQNDSQLSELESCIKSTFNPVDIFVNQLLY